MYCQTIASSPGHSHVFYVATLKTWEWPGDEASQTIQCHIIIIACSYRGVVHLTAAYMRFEHASCIVSFIREVLCFARCQYKVYIV